MGACACVCVVDAIVLAGSGVVEFAAVVAAVVAAAAVAVLVVLVVVCCIASFALCLLACSHRYAAVGGLVGWLVGWLVGPW